MSTIMELITKTRQENHITQEQFARELSKALEPIKGLTTTTIRNWESGRTSPDYFMMYYVAHQDTPKWLRDFATDAMEILTDQKAKT